MFIYGTYVLGVMQMQNFLRVIQIILMEFIAGRFFTKQRKQLLQANDKLYEGVELRTKNIRFSPEYRDNQANTQDNDG